MTITVTPDQRDALLGEILIRLSGIEAVWYAAKEGKYEEAERLGREFSDILLLVLDDLGFGDGTGESIELKTAPVVVRRVLERVRQRAKVQRETEHRGRVEKEDGEAEAALVEEACDSLLAALDAV
ncbi:MAG: hypothetical protein QOE56_1064 [Solirubrobacterales bacterium]|jgi:hypothetical protein|nr:hypothetical protein [Solirubrobacterales bacterium]